MNYRIISAFLGMIAVILGLSMFLCLPWGLPAFGGGSSEVRGAVGLLLSGGLSTLLGATLIVLGRRADKQRLFRKEAIIIVSLSWILAIILSATPYLFSKTERVPGVPMSFCDALFESASGLTTTGATVFGELENTETLPRTILFWRGMTHFLGGLGVVCIFVVLIGHGSGGKAVMKIEHSVSGSIPASKIRTQATYLFYVYISLNVACGLLLLLCGMSLYDAITHSFSVIATGGFSTHNASIAYFTGAPHTNGLAIECVIIFFMIVSGTNHWLLYWAAIGQPQRLFRDSEWRLYVSLILLGIAITTSFGLLHGDFRIAPKTQDGPPAVGVALDGILTNDGSEDPETLNRRPQTTINTSAEHAHPLNAVHRSAFHVVSLMTGVGFVTERYELWNSTSLTVLMILMFVGGCAGSTSGGAKVFRVLLSFKALIRYLSETFSPNVVRTTRLDGENVDKGSLYSAVVYIFVMHILIFFTAIFVMSFEPNGIWLARGESQVEKMTDIYVASISLFGNVGPAFGALGSFENYGALTGPTKLVFSSAMLLGRLEVWTVLALLSPNFWRDR